MSDAATSNAQELLRRSLERGRLGHAYLFVGDAAEVLEDAALLLARTLLCTQPTRRSTSGIGVEPCGTCSACRRVTHQTHPDVTWLRPGKKSRVISVAQIRDLIHVAQVRPTEASYKIGIVAGAERMRVEAANAFLKTLEEPPPDSVFILLTTDVERLLETILSRCLRLNFASGTLRVDDTVAAWLESAAGSLADATPTLLQRYHLLQSLLDALGTARAQIEETLTSISPLQRFPDADAEQRERWEDELDAAVEAEYRRRRGEFLAGVHAWLRDLWMLRIGSGTEAALPRLTDLSARISQRIPVDAARANLERWERTQRLLLGTNAQEALVLEVGLLRLSL
jgi:DNA polymerase-3 subunit delta'